VQVELSGVSKRFGAVRALDGVTVTLPDGARVALIGPNGSGKSTLIRVVMGLVACDGEVRLDGQPVAPDRRPGRERLAYVPQFPPQAAATVGDLVSAVARVRRLARAPITRAFPDLDWGSLRRRPFRALSGGTRQKVLLALAFAADPTLLILDEPAASLDAPARLRFLELCAALRPDATLLCCSHRLEEIRHLVDRVLLLEEGRVAWEGPAERFGAERGAVPQGAAGSCREQTDPGRPRA